MMENRSFDHYLGWLGSDEQYLEAGKSRWGKQVPRRRQDRPHLRRRRRQAAQDAPPRPQRRRTASVPRLRAPDPGARLERRAGRARRRLPGRRHRQRPVRDRLLPGRGPARPLAQLARRFTVLDRSFASLLAGTFPNRQYAYTAQSDGQREDPIPLLPGMYKTPTIFGKLIGQQVPVRGLLHRSPVARALGRRSTTPGSIPIDDYFDACAAGTLPNVVAISPAFGGDLRTDDHSQGDVLLGQRFIREVFKAFAQSKHWERGLFILTYDEWGGFFDHVQAADAARPARQRRPRERLRARRLPRADDPGVALRAAELRRPPGLRPHVDPALPRVALPGRTRPRGRAATAPGTSPCATATPTTSQHPWVPPIRTPSSATNSTGSRSGPTA